MAATAGRPWRFSHWCSRSCSPRWASLLNWSRSLAADPMSAITSVAAPGVGQRSVQMGGELLGGFEVAPDRPGRAVSCPEAAGEVPSPCHHVAEQGGCFAQHSAAGGSVWSRCCQTTRSLRVRGSSRAARPSRDTEGQAAAAVSYLGLDLVIPAGVFAPTPTSDLLGRAVLAEVRPGDRVLDMGTGCGVNAILAARVAHDVVGVDLNKNAITAARANAARNGVTAAFARSQRRVLHGEWDLRPDHH